MNPNEIYQECDACHYLSWLWREIDGYVLCPECLERYNGDCNYMPEMLLPNADS